MIGGSVNNVTKYSYLIMLLELVPFKRMWLLASVIRIVDLMNID